MKELKGQLVGALLIILTVAAVVAAGINFQQQRKFHLPEDGVTWVDRPLEQTQSGSAKTHVVALYVVPGSAGDHAGVHEGDVLRRIDTVPVERAADVPQVLLSIGVWKKATYSVERADPRRAHALPVEVNLSVVVSERSTSPAIFYQYLVGAVYLFIGLFVFFRRGTADRALHFSLLCLFAFLVNTFHYTGKLNNFDKFIYYGNFIGGLMMQSLFLHFALIFPRPPNWFRQWWKAAALYVPTVALSLLLIGVSSGVLRMAIPAFDLRWLIDRVWLLLYVCGLLAGAAVLAWRYRQEEDAVIRKQLKWLRNGAVLGVLPFTIFYAVPYALGAVPSPRMEMAVLSLGLVPLTWAYAIARYRLMDVDVIFQQGYVYTLATIAVLAVFYGMAFSLAGGTNPQTGEEGRFDNIPTGALVSLILIAAFVFQPIRKWLQEILDRHVFYRNSYDYRRTLIEFARELGTETDLNLMLNSVSDRLLRTLNLQRLAYFLANESDGETARSFRLYMTAGTSQPVPDALDLSFLSGTLPPAAAGEDPKPYLFFERTRHAIDIVSRDLPASVRHTIADLDLTYYIPCTARGRIIAYLGISRTDKGDFLSSDDVELLVTLCGYVGIAMENARLYRSLERKAEEYERLKEFSENIVESINVGILAVDFEDVVESWNTQMEALTGIRRADAVGSRIRDLFALDLVAQFEIARQTAGVHNIYKFPVRTDSLCNIAVAPLISKQQEQIGRLIIFDNVTERAELESRLVQADKLSSIGLLAAGVAHEVNTPLAVISTYAQMLAKQVSEDDSKSKLLEKIAKQTFRASEIVNSLLNFSRTGSTAFDEVDLNKVIRETISLVSPQLDKTRVRISDELASDPGLIRGNTSKLQQVFLNLFLNARDAMEQGGTLAVRTSLADDLMRVEVTDTGCGIPPEQLERIYDPFFTTKSAKKGTGLGLSISYGIVKEHGGSIVAASQPGQGTRFVLEFPLVRNPVLARNPVNV